MAAVRVGAVSEASVQGRARSMLRLMARVGSLDHHWQYREVVEDRALTWRAGAAGRGSAAERRDCGAGARGKFGADRAECEGGADYGRLVGAAEPAFLGGLGAQFGKAHNVHHDAVEVEILGH